MEKEGTTYTWPDKTQRMLLFFITLEVYRQLCRQFHRPLKERLKNGVSNAQFITVSALMCLHTNWSLGVTSNFPAQARYLTLHPSSLYSIPSSADWNSSQDLASRIAVPQNSPSILLGLHWNEISSSGRDPGNLWSRLYVYLLPLQSATPFSCLSRVSLRGVQGVPAVWPNGREQKDQSQLCCWYIPA